MARSNYTPEQLEFLRIGYLEMQVPELTSSFNEHFESDKSEKTIKSTLQNHGFKCGRPTGTPKGTFRSYTQEQVEFITSEYKSLSISELTSAFNAKFNDKRSMQQIRAFTRNHSVKSGRTGQFEKGTKPWNTGTKGATSANKTSFKKGSIPKTIKPLGHERVCPKDGYILVKVAEKNPYTGHPTRYRPKHQVVWEQHHGKIPKGHIVLILDGYKKNCTIENLRLITRQELRYLNKNGFSSLPTDLRETMLAVAKLEAKRFGLIKESNTDD